MKPATHEESAARRIRNVLQTNGRASTQEIAVGAGAEPGYVAKVLYQLVASGKARSLGRGLYADVPDGASPGFDSLEAGLGEEVKSMLQLLSREGIDVIISGYDIIGAFGNQLPATWPHLLLVNRGAGEWAGDTLRPAHLAVLIEPSKDALRTAVELPTSHPIVLVRERSLTQKSFPAQASKEDAWVDLVSEHRMGYPIGRSELREILNGMAGHTSWTKLVRSARRRGIRIHVDANRDLPIAADDPQRDKFLADILAQ